MLLVLGDSASLSNNFFKVIPPEKHFERIFGLDQDAAAAFGYRPHNAPKSLEMDARFWNPSRLVPGPDDEAYAIGCLLKLCQAAPSSGSTAAAVGGGLDEAPAPV